MDFPVPLGTSGCPAQLQVHDQSNAPVRTTRRPHALPGGCPSKSMRPVFAGPATLCPMVTFPAPLQPARVASCEPSSNRSSRSTRLPESSVHRRFPWASTTVYPVAWGEFYSPRRAPRKGMTKDLFKIFLTGPDRLCGRPVDGPGEHLWTSTPARSRPCAECARPPVEDGPRPPETTRPRISHAGQHAATDTTVPPPSPAPVRPVNPSTASPVIRQVSCYPAPRADHAARARKMAGPCMITNGGRRTGCMISEGEGQRGRGARGR